MKLIDHQVRLSDGETIIIRVADDGSGISACPVCGHLAEADLPWDSYVHKTTVDGVECKEFYASPSWDICPCCHTQFGLEGAGDIEGPVTMQQLYVILRERWLAKIERTAEIDEQLKNLSP